MALAELDGWGEESRLLAQLVACQYRCDWRALLPGWQDQVEPNKHG